MSSVVQGNPAKITRLSKKAQVELARQIELLGPTVCDLEIAELANIPRYVKMVAEAREQKLVNVTKRRREPLYTLLAVLGIDKDELAKM